MNRNKPLFGRLSVFLLLIGLSIGYGAGQSDVMNYEIWVELDADKNMLFGRQSLEWTNHSVDNINEIYFHLYWNAFKNENSAFLQEGLESSSLGKRSGRLNNPQEAGWIDIKSISVANGADLTDSMKFVIPDLPQRPGDQTVMKIKLIDPLLPGETISLELQFESKIPRTIARSGYYQDSYFIGQWFPKPGVYEEGKGWNCHQYHMHTEFFAEYAEFMVHITVPKEFVVGASGRMISEISREYNQTVTYSYWQDRIHDFAWSADPKFIKLNKVFMADSLISMDEYVKYAKIFNLPVDEIKLPDLTMILLIREEHAAQADRHFAALEQAVKYFGLLYGPYPYETITVIDPPYRTKSGGMEYPTLITAQTNLFISEYERTPEDVIMHEFGHQYWYGMVGSNEFEEAWLDEGINTYCEGRIKDKLYGKASLIPGFFGWPFSRYFRDMRYYSWEMNSVGVVFVESDKLIKPSWQFYDGMSYGMNVYSRASTLLSTLERILGEETMLHVMRQFQTRYRFTHPNTQDFISTVNEVGGRDMNWFFDELFYEANNFDYGIGGVSSRRVLPAKGIFESDSGKTVVGNEEIEAQSDSIKQYLSIINVRRFGEARLGGDEQLHVRFTFEDSSVVDKYWNGRDRWTEFRMVTASPLKLAQTDPRGKYLIDSNLSNNSYRMEAQTGGVKRWVSKLMFWIQNIMQMASIFS